MCSGSNIQGETSTWQLSLKFDEWLGRNGNFNCGICLSDLPKCEKFPMKGCIHLFCNDCISTYVTTHIKENNIPIKCPMLDCKFSFLQLDACRNIITEEMIEKWGNLMEDSTFGLPNKDQFNSQNSPGTSKDDEILLMNLAHRNRWKSCPKCNICIEKVDGCRMVKCRYGTLPCLLEFIDIGMSLFCVVFVLKLQ